MSDPISEFIAFLHRNGISPAYAREIIGNDRKNRYTIAGDKPKSLNGSYRLGVVEGIWMGWARSHKMGQSVKYRSDNQKDMTPEERKRLDAALARRKKDNEERTARQHNDVAEQAYKMYTESTPLFGPHPYTTRKNLDWRGLRTLNGSLIITLHDIKGKIWNIQRILKEKDSSGNDKYFLPGGRVKGCYHAIGRIRPLSADPIITVEGWATGKTLHRILDVPIACAIQANNIPNIGTLLRRKYPNQHLIFAADHDRWSKKPDGTPWNAGIHYARSAAESTGGSLQTLPERLGQHDSHPTDFNDMANIEGDDAVLRCFEKFLR